MEIDLADKNIPIKPQTDIPAVYKGRNLKKHYVADLLVYDSIIV